MSSSRSDHIAKAKELLEEWENQADRMETHPYCMELLAAAQAHATLAESMRVM